MQVRLSSFNGSSLPLLGRRRISGCFSVELALLLDTAELLLGLLHLLLLLLGEVVEKGLVLVVNEVVVVSRDDRIRVVESDLLDVGHDLDLSSDLLVLSIRHVVPELVGTALDGVPASQSAGEVDVSRHAKVRRGDDLVCGGVVEDSLGVDTSLVGEGTETGDVVVEGNVDLDHLGNKLLDFLELLDAVQTVSSLYDMAFS